MVLKYEYTDDEYEELQEVSVPLRGYGFEIFFFERMILMNTELFPSPCGDMVLKYHPQRNLGARPALFPSPCGDMVLKLMTGVCIVRCSVFPSPCGDMVLKSRRIDLKSKRTTSFRPLAGIWF